MTPPLTPISDDDATTNPTTPDSDDETLADDNVTTSGSTGFPPVVAYIMMGVIVLCLGGIGYLISIIRRATVKGDGLTKSEPIELIKA